MHEAIDAIIGNKIIGGKRRVALQVKVGPGAKQKLSAGWPLLALHAYSKKLRGAKQRKQIKRTLPSDHQRNNYRGCESSLGSTVYF